MTVTAQGTAPSRTVPGTPVRPRTGSAASGRSRTVPGAQAVPPAPPAAGPRPRRVPLTPMRQQAAKSMRKLAASVQETHPDLIVHQHLRDAARTLESGNEEGAERHLRAAIGKLTPQQLMKNGMHTDDLHIGAKQAMDGVHRHLLLVKDISDVAAKNQRAIARDSCGDDASFPPMPQPPVHADPNAGYGPGALAQKPTARQPPGNQALNAPNRAGTGKPDPNVADPVGPQPRGSKQFTTRNGVRAVTELAYGWNDLEAAIEFSAKTASLEVTPAPYGKPGGPGLYGVKGNKHSDYEEQIVKALMEKRGMDKGRATAIARGSIRKWMVKSRHPEVRAAAGRAETQEIAAQARAHAHANSWDEVAAHILDLATAPPPAAGSSPKQQTAAKQARVAAGNTGGGQFTKGGGGQPDAHQQHMAHLAAQQKQGKGSATASKTAKATAAKNAQSKQGLLKQAAGYRAQADALIKQRDALRAALASASGKTSSGQSGSTTSSGASTTKSTAPAAASTAPAAASTASSTAPASTASTTSTSASSTSLTSAQKAQASAQIAQLNTQIVGLQKQYAQAMAQAAKL